MNALFFSDRYCGGLLSCRRNFRVTQPLYSKSFYAQFVTNSVENVPTGSNGERGFSLNYSQESC